MADKRIQQYPDKNNPSSSDYILIADSQDIDVNGFRKYKKIKISALDNIVITNAEDIERQDLIQLLNDNEAVIGRFYRITDSQIGEPILVQAVALNMISEMSVSGDDGIVYFYDIITDTRTNIQHVEINGTGFVKANGTTITYDNSTYLTNINGITAGGELSGTYPNPSLSNNAVTGKVLTGLSISGSSITSTDSILTSLGKLQNQINSLVGGVKYQGTWNASTNTPTLVSSVGINGYYYVVDVAGSTNLNGITDWKVGDWAIFNGTTWQKVDNTDSVISVNGYTGAVTLTTSDIAEGTNLYYTDARVRQAISENIVGINYDSNTGLFSLASGYVIPTTTEQSNWNTAYNNRISSLTTVGNSGAATLVSNTLNIPNYTLGGLGGVPYTGATANVDLGEFGIKAGYFEYDLTPTNTPTTQGTTYWDSTEETVALIMNGAIQHVGLDTFYNVKNGTGSTIPKGTAVRFDGTDGGSGHLLIAPMLANGFYPSTYYMGITAEDIGSGDFGKVMQFGKLRGINTNSYTNGDILYVSTSSAGGFQTTVPTAPNNIIIAAAVVRASNNGTLMVRATLGSNINSDEGVKITSPTTGQLLQLQSNGLWENKTKAQVLGGTSSQFVKGDGSLDSTSYQPLDSNLTAIAGLSGDGLLRKTSGTWGMDTNTYLTGNQTITISGEASGSGATSITLSLDNNSVTGKVLNGLSISGGSVVSTDSILVGIGKLQNQVNALAGGVNYQGTWNASTNTPSLTSSVGVKGYYYVVSVAGSTNLDGITDWKLGDWAIFNGSTWQKVDNTDAVISVNGYTGAVTLTKSDVGLGNVENTALSTWAGSTNITTLGTIGTGVWNGTAIGDSYISSASTWNAKIGGSGTSGKLPKFTASGTIGDSILSESGSVISVAGALNIGNGITTGNIDFSINGSSGVRFDLTNGILGINRGSGLDIRLYYTGGNTAFRVSNSSGELFINRTPTTSAGSFDLLTRNTSTGAVEKVASNYYATAGSISGTTGKLAKFTSSGAVGDSIVTESSNGITTSINQSASTTLVVVENTNNTSGTARASLRSISGAVTSELLSISGFGLFLGTSSNHRVSLMMNGSEYLGINATNGRIQTNQATDTGESFIVGGSARVNGFMLATGLLRTQDRLYITGDVAISSWISSSLTAGYSSTSSYGWINSQTSLRLGVNGSTQLNLTTSAATFSSSVTATSLRAVSGGTLALNRPDNGANSEIYTNSSNQLILSSAIGGIITLGTNTLIGTTTDNGVDKLQVNGSISTASLTGFRLLSGGSPLFTIGYSGGTLFDRLSGTNFFIAENGSPQLTIASGGNVGIGTTNPSQKLSISSANNTTALGISIGSNANYYFSANSTSGYTVSFNINDTGAYIGHNSAARSLIFQTANLDRLTIDGSGAATFSSSIAIGNAVTTSTNTPSTHKVEIVIGGVTYYLLATT